MKISIITVCRNSAKTIARTLDSVAMQRYPNIEHLVIDGASTDDTLAVIKGNQRHITSFISEPDEGIYNAMNKGFSLASGDIVAFLNSDDAYIDVEVLSDVMKVFEFHSVDFVYGDLLMVDENGLICRDWRSGPIPDAGLNGSQIPHPVFFVKRSLLAKVIPVFDESYRIAADLKQQLIIINIFNAKGFYIKRPLVRMALGGASTSGLKSYISGWIESRRAYNEVIGRGGTSYTIRKVFSKLKDVRHL